MRQFEISLTGVLTTNQCMWKWCIRIYFAKPAMNPVNGYKAAIRRRDYSFGSDFVGNPDDVASPPFCTFAA